LEHRLIEVNADVAFARVAKLANSLRPSIAQMRKHIERVFAEFGKAW